MLMSLLDRLKDAGFANVKEMDGVERTHFMNDIYLDYQACKNLQQTKMEKFYLELLEQLIEDYGN
jgi:hypothetical protein